MLKKSLLLVALICFINAIKADESIYRDNSGSPFAEEFAEEDDAVYQRLIAFEYFLENEASSEGKRVVLNIERDIFKVIYAYLDLLQRIAHTSVSVVREHEEHVKLSLGLVLHDLAEIGNDLQTICLKHVFIEEERDAMQLENIEIFIDYIEQTLEKFYAIIDILPIENGAYFLISKHSWDSNEIVQIRQELLDALSNKPQVAEVLVHRIFLEVKEYAAYVRELFDEFLSDMRAFHEFGLCDNDIFVHVIGDRMRRAVHFFRTLSSQEASQLKLREINSIDELTINDIAEYLCDLEYICDVAKVELIKEIEKRN